MSTEILLLAGLIVAVVGLAVYLINKKVAELAEASKQDEALTEWLKSMQTTVEGTNRTLNEAMRATNKDLSDTLQKSTQSLNERLDNAGKFIAQVAKEVGQMSELGQSMRDLQVFLQSPKIRGNIGEQVLKDLIAQAFPKGSFHLQYSFKSGDKVDAAIQTSAGILPVDSKFPMENFKKMRTAETKKERTAAKRQFKNDVRKHIRDIAGKYILPEEGTLDFAFMYLPSEMVFIEVANDSDLLEYARRRRIYPVSPNTLYVHLQTVLLSFEGQKLESRSREVFRVLRAIQKDYEKTEGLLSTLSRHINNAFNQMSNVASSFSLLGQKLETAGALSEGQKKQPDQLEAGDGD